MTPSSFNQETFRLFAVGSFNWLLLQWQNIVQNQCDCLHPVFMQMLAFAVRHCLLPFLCLQCACRLQNLLLYSETHCPVLLQLVDLPNFGILRAYMEHVWCFLHVQISYARWCNHKRPNPEMNCICCFCRSKDSHWDRLFWRCVANDFICSYNLGFCLLHHFSLHYVAGIFGYNFNGFIKAPKAFVSLTLTKENKKNNAFSK